MPKHKKIQPRQNLVRVVVNSANARLDYWLTLQQVEEFNLPIVSVYGSERTWYDPTAKFRQRAEPNNRWRII